VDFSQLNETDVREEIIAPLVRELGYRSASEHNVLREQSLRYPRAFLGRKNPDRDPLLRGKADYILEAGRKVRWVIEAKAPGGNIGIDEIEQAWTYANHPEVRAIYFVLCNGQSLEVYQTNHGPSVPPVISLSYEQMQTEAAKQALLNLLSPDALLRDHGSVKIDIGPPLGPGLRSIARIAHGFIRYNQSSLPLPALLEMQVSIIGGSLERDEANGLVALLETRAPTRTVQMTIERLGLHVLELVSAHSTLSTNPDFPTEFVYEGETTFPKGAKLVEPNGWNVVSLPQDIHVRVRSVARGILELNRFSGSIHNQMVYGEQVPASLVGEFAIFLA
jgi:hypothetical protein